VHANLMCAPCAEPAAHQRIPVAVRDDGVRCLARNTRRVDDHPATISRITAERQCDPSLARLRRPADDRQVFLDYAGGACIALNTCMHARRKSHHDQPDVSLSRRLTSPGRMSFLSRTRQRTPLRSVPDGLRNDGCTTIPAGLFTANNASSS